MTRSRVVVAAAAGLLLASFALLAGCAAGGSTSAAVPGPAIRVAGDQHGYRGAWLDRPYAKPAPGFVDASGRPFNLAADTTKPVTLVFFGYTSCPDVCLDVLAGGRRRLAPGRRAGARPGPAGLRDRRPRPGHACGDAGVPGAVRPVLHRADRAAGHDRTRDRQLDIALDGTTRLPSGGYEVGHGAQLIGFGPPDGKGHLVWGSTTPVAALRHDIVRLATAGA